MNRQTIDSIDADSIRELARLAEALGAGDLARACCDVLDGTADRSTLSRVVTAWADVARIRGDDSGPAVSTAAEFLDAGDALDALAARANQTCRNPHRVSR